MISLPVLGFESRYHLRRPTFWIIAAVFFAIATVDMVSKGSEGNAFFFVNSPLQIFQTVIWYSIFAILAASAFVAETFVRDVQNQTEELILATPISKSRYLGMRFAAAFGMALLAFSAYLPGMILGSLLPGLNEYAIGPLRLDAYVLSFVAITLPNLFLVSVIAFGLAARTRSLAITYAGGIILVMLYLASLLMIGGDIVDFEQYRVWALADPFGFFALEEQAFTWTVHQYNTLMPPLSGTFIANRLLWLAIATGIWALSYWGFRLKLPQTRTKSSSRINTVQSAPPIKPQTKTFAIANADAIGPRELVRQWLYQSVFESRMILQGRAFLLLTGAGLVSLVMAALGSRSFSDSNPSTDILIHSANIYLEYILFAIIVVYAAEAIERDRTVRIQDVIDATPVSNGVLLLGKLTGLFVVITINLVLAMGVMVGYQVFKGYTQFEFGLYFQMLFLEHGPYFYLTAVLALFTQVVTRRKYLGMAIVIAVSVSHIPLDALGWYHNLYRIFQTNDIEYSPMNGYGGLFTGHLWYVLYWSLWAVALGIAAYVLWPRGLVEGNVFKRWCHSWRQTQQLVKRSLFGILFAIAGVGSWIFYNTVVVNAYQPFGKEETAAAIETNYKQYESLPMPVVTNTEVTVELYPEERYFEATGKYLLENRTESPISELHLLTFINLNLGEVSYPGATLREADPELGYYIYDLATPLQPGESQTLEFTTATNPARGFRNQVDSDDVYMIYPNDVVFNGSNLYSPFILPFVGYTKMVEQKKAWLRSKLGLSPLSERMRSHNDPGALEQALMVTHLAWGDLDITVGTSEEHTGVTTGELVKQWREGDRNYYRYQSTKPSRGKFTIFSGDYAIHRTEDYGIPIEIYYHPQHTENIDYMVQQAGQALELFQDRFGEFPFKQLRLVEFVYYDGMIHSDAGTIGIPEVLAWKSEPSDRGRMALTSWVTYLLAQAWWEDQLISADVAGGMSIREALSDYASNLYLRSQQSPEEQRRAKQQRQRDYFRKLGKIDFKEPPLADIYNELPIARHKGGMVLEQVEFLIGQEALLTGITNFLAQYRYQGPPYATVLNLKDAIAAGASEKYRSIIDELFREVITYQVGVSRAVYEPLDSGDYRIKLTIDAQKRYTADLGKQESVPLDFPLSVKIQNQDKETIFQQEFSFEEVQNDIEITVSQEPATASIDNDYALPSPTLYDNVGPIKRER
ncbi:MAG: ABC transporter permease [Cyanobacteria bacterium P01_H01_bin.15]